MNARNKIITTTLTTFLFTLSSYSIPAVNHAPDQVRFTVEQAPEWTALFKRYRGWFGADGIFAIPLDGKDNIQAGSRTRTMLIFSDSLIGEVERGQLRPGFDLVNNTVAFLIGNQPKQDNLKFEWAKNTASKPIAMFTPKTPTAEKGDYYWLGDGFVNNDLNNATYVFAYRMRNLDSDDDWSFRKMGTNLLVIDKNVKAPFTNHRQIDVPFDFEDGGFGAGILVNTKEAGAPKPDGYVYVYGVRGKEKNLMVARVLPKDFENFDAWRFWDGQDWNQDAHRVSYIASGVSNELSVTPTPEGNFVLIYQYQSISSKIAMQIGTTPYDTFGPMTEIWDCPEAKRENIYTYNAKAHPSLSPPGELLISYNVNAFGFMDEIQKDPNLYRPRFIRLKFETSKVH